MTSNINVINNLASTIVPLIKDNAIVIGIVFIVFIALLIASTLGGGSPSIGGGRRKRSFFGSTIVITLWLIAITTVGVATYHALDLSQQDEPTTSIFN